MVKKNRTILGERLNKQYNALLLPLRGTESEVVLNYLSCIKYYKHRKKIIMFRRFHCLFLENIKARWLTFVRLYILNLEQIYAFNQNTFFHIMNIFFTL